MRHHPLTPMTDSEPRRACSAGRPRHPVGLLDLSSVRARRRGVGARLAGPRAAGVRHVVVDATDDADLATVATAAVATAGCSTGGAGLAGALGARRSPATARRRHPAPTWTCPPGPAMVLAGSCSRATLDAGRAAQQSCPSLPTRPRWRPRPRRPRAATALTGCGEHLRRRSRCSIYSSARRGQRERRDAAMGPDTAAHPRDARSGSSPRRPPSTACRRIVVAGGETSGAVVQALGVDSRRSSPARRTAACPGA